MDIVAQLRLEWKVISAAPLHFSVVIVVLAVGLGGLFGEQWNGGTEASLRMSVLLTSLRLLS